MPGQRLWGDQSLRPSVQSESTHRPARHRGARHRHRAGSGGGTEFSNVRFKGDDAKAGKTYENTEALTPEDVTEAVWWVATLPKHVNINTLEMMPVSQSFAGLSVHRQG